MDIETSDFKSLDGKRVGVLLGTEAEIMLTDAPSHENDEVTPWVVGA